MRAVEGLQLYGGGVYKRDRETRLTSNLNPAGGGIITGKVSV
jgi:hypothetical protein